ncbi:MAG: S41 family peptidase, partial [Verrucomicrobia bacterium]
EVHLVIHRPDTGETFERTIVRKVIHLDSVRDVRMLEGEIGYIRLVQFGERTVDEFNAGLEKLRAEGMQSLILDLRDNPGGLLAVATRVLEPFFDRGELMLYTQGRDPKSREDIRANGRGERLRLPIAVLINGGSASAAEIVAGALREYHRAVLVGERSFGKGSVQTVFPLGRDRAVRLTTALYYLPSGTVIHGEGIEPDIRVTLTAEEDRKLFIQRNRLPLMTPEDFRERFGFAPIEDRQLTAAIDALRGLRVLSRILSAGGGEG